MFDPASSFARELLSMFGKNTAVYLDHKYGHDTIRVVVARTGNIIAQVEYYEGISAHSAALDIMAMRSFPKPRNTKRSWSPIRLSEKAREMMEADSGIRFA
jgi:hypothetical protein